MKIENLIEKDTVLDDDYLIVNGTDGTKKAKKITFLSDVNSSLQLDTIEISIPKGSISTVSAYQVGKLVIFSVAFIITTTVNEDENVIQFPGISAKSRFDFAIYNASTLVGDGALLAGTNGIIANSISLNPGAYFCTGSFVVN